MRIIEQQKQPFIKWDCTKRKQPSQVARVRIGPPLFGMDVFPSDELIKRVMEKDTYGKAY